MALIMLILCQLRLAFVMLFHKVLNFLCKTSIKIDQILPVSLIIRHTPSGEVIKIHAGDFIRIFSVPDFPMAIGIHDKVAVVFRLLQLASMDQKVSFHIKEQTHIKFFSCHTQHSLSYSFILYFVRFPFLSTSQFSQSFFPLSANFQKIQP